MLIEIIGIIASILAMITAAVAIYRHFKRTDLRIEEIRKTNLDKLDYFENEWRRAGFGSKHMHLIHYNEFIAIARFRELVEKLSPSKQRYFFVSAIVHGKWGEWWPKSTDLIELVRDIIPLLDGSSGWRPLWRTAYILECVSRINGTEWIELIPKELKRNRHVQQTVEAIQKSKVIEFLEKTGRGENQHLKDKALSLQEEVLAYSESTNKYLAQAKS